MSVLRILHAIRNLDPKAGGPTEVCRRLAAAQTVAGHTVVIVAEVGTPDVPKGVAIRECHRAGLREWVTGGKVYREALEAVCGADIVHLHGVWDPFLQVVAAAARTSGIPYVVMPHGMLDPWSMAQKKLKKRLALLLGTRRMLNRAAGFHLLYPEEGDVARMLDISTPGCVVPNGVDLAEIDPIPTPVEFRASVPALGDSPYLLFLGRLHHKKGLDYLGDAFARLAPQLPDLQLVVAGPDEGDEMPFREQCRRLGIESRVHMVGPVYGSRKWSALAGAECFCLPSRQEGFSVAVLEAMACRCPVVISDQCHFPQVAESCAGSVVGLDSAAIADAIAGVVSDPQRRLECGRNGRALIESVYTWERVSQQLVDHYHTFIRRQLR